MAEWNRSNGDSVETRRDLTSASRFTWLICLRPCLWRGRVSDTTDCETTKECSVRQAHRRRFLDLNFPSQSGTLRKRFSDARKTGGDLAAPFPSSALASRHKSGETLSRPALNKRLALNRWKEIPSEALVLDRRTCHSELFGKSVWREARHLINLCEPKRNLNLSFCVAHDESTGQTLHATPKSGPPPLAPDESL
eukprot:scaffold34_cov260-Pinguiococcus_pyrenoidosus.AAC.48